MGATITESGVNFAVFSSGASAVDLCLFSPDGHNEIARLELDSRTGDVWHGHVAGLTSGQLYGFRAHGPHAPTEGKRFNPAKLLLDPYGKALSGPLRWSDDLTGTQPGSDLAPDPRDSAPFMVKSKVVYVTFDWEDDQPPATPLCQTVIYEAHVKALTRLHPDIPDHQRGTYAALGHPAVIAHLKRIGATAIEVLPIHAFLDDRFVTSRGLTNHWGYNTIGFFAVEPRYGTLDDFKSAVKSLHRAGIEVILDVVYNHTGEGDEFGPTLSFRGLDNEVYYRTHSGGTLYANDAGTGNTFDLSQAPVIRMVLDSLRYWAHECHVDGFRFDLAPVLGRGPNGFDSNAAFFRAVLDDPVLSRLKLIAEPWDIGPGGYQLGNFPAPFLEWNDSFRDTVRKFWRGDPGAAPGLASCLMGSAALFDKGQRAATSSVNFITAHDGFTLADLTSYSTRHNLANGEMGRDGHGDNHSDNMGIEGPSADDTVNQARALRRRNLLATLLLSQGTPMMLAGDEIGHSQGGNNNAYAQDNSTTWLDWDHADAPLLEFVAKLTSLRAAHPALRQVGFVHGQVCGDGIRDAIWHRADGQEPSGADWHDPGFRCFGVELRMADGGNDVVYLVINGGNDCRLHLPGSIPSWRCVLDTSCPDSPPFACDNQLDLRAQTVVVFIPDV